MARAPHQPNYTKDEVLDYLRELRSLDGLSDWEEEYGMDRETIGKLISEMLERDPERMKDEMRVGTLMNHQYKTRSWVTDEENVYKHGEEEKATQHIEVRDKDNSDAWIRVSQSFYKD